MSLNKNIFRLEHVVESIEKAIRNVDEELITMYPKVPWKEARGMRNLLVHEYFRIEHSEVRRTLKQDLPNLKMQILSIINDIK